jgi:hypothetical protein
VNPSHSKDAKGAIVGAVGLFAIVVGVLMKLWSGGHCKKDGKRSEKEFADQNANLRLQNNN